MLNTIAEANYYGTTMLLRGVIEVIIEEEPLLGLLPVKQIIGNSLTYNRELVLPSGEFYNPGDDWTEETGTIEPTTVALKILGKDADVDQFLAKTRANVNDIEGEVLAMSAKGIARTAVNELIYGAVATNAKGFDGFHSIIGAGGATQEVQAGTTTTGGPGTFSKLDELIDLVPYANKVLVMARRTRRGIQKLARGQGWELAMSSPGGSINQPVVTFGGLPIFISDFITITEDVVSGGFGGKTGDDATSIFCVGLGEDAFHLLESGHLTIEDLGILEGKDARRRRIKWYLSAALMSTVAIARMSGVDDQAWVN